MSTAADAREDGGAILLRIKDHLHSALELLDRINPHAVVGARLQHCVDDVEALIAASYDPRAD